MPNVDFPCWVNANDLKRDENGHAICDECNKRIHRRIAGPVSGSVCAVDTSGSGWPRTIETFRRRFLVILLITFGSSLFSNLNAQIQVDVDANTGKQEVTAGNVIQGTIYDDMGEVLPFAAINIHVGEELTRTMSDVNGEYKIQISANGDAEIKVTVSYPGFEDVRIHDIAWKGGEVNTLDVHMIGTEFLMLGVVVEPMIETDPKDHRKTSIGRQEIERSAR